MFSNPTGGVHNKVHKIMKTRYRDLPTRFTIWLVYSRSVIGGSVNLQSDFKKCVPIKVSIFTLRAELSTLPLSNLETIGFRPGTALKLTFWLGDWLCVYMNSSYVWHYFTLNNIIKKLCSLSNIPTSLGSIHFVWKRSGQNSRTRAEVCFATTNHNGVVCVPKKRANW